ncbi:divisome protein SepX/GlpR [Nocardia carnea]|uniref:divisome protein SepX/GlpR n=1 Tax=Nocardia carnea TaxID=37328 RepID=UPI00245781BC|nr:gephyrin-like molybdotransferase receptor GlpR [Nocardia carnea]
MPNSILWIGLVVLWVFVLFPILADRHPRIRRTTDTALATRVLHRGDSKRRKGSGYVRKKRSGRPYRKRHHGNDAEDRMTTTAEETVTEADEKLPHTDSGDGSADIFDDFETPEEFEDNPDSDDDTEAAPAGDTAAETEPLGGDAMDTAPARIPPVRSGARRAPEAFDDEGDFVPTRRGRGGYDPEADAIARAARYTFRQRAVVALILGTVLCGGLAVAIGPLFWWGCGGALLSLVTYLGYLRKQVRIEQEIRRRRSARLADRDRDLGDEPVETEESADPAAARPGMDRDTARALRRRSHLLEPDDEDPVFEHLDAYDATIARTVRHRASGGDIRRAAGA